MFPMGLSSCNKYKCLNIFIVWIVSSWIIWNLRFNLLHIFKFTLNTEYRDCVHLRHSYEAKVQTSPLYITLTRHGRLGNWLYSYASLLGIAKANGYIPYLLSTHPLRYTFQISKLGRNDADCLLTITDPLPCGYVPKFNHLPAANISIDGYIQSWKYFQFVETEIRNEFKFSTSFELQIHAIYLSYVSSYLKEGRVVITVHVRRGDKLSKGFQALGFKPAPLEFFENAMNYMAKKYPFSVFLVLSDETQWCEENLKSVTLEIYDTENRHAYENFRIVDGHERSAVEVSKTGRRQIMQREKIPIVFVSQHSSTVDLGLLTLANHSIISVGTFGWWGAWLANGSVVYYKNHVIPGSVLESQTVNEDFFPAHWVPMSSAIIVSVSLFSIAITMGNLFYYLHTLL